MNQKVVWCEGMVLRPHHFQQWDRYYEGLVAERFRTLDPFSWGVKSLTIDHDELATGRLRIRTCSLVMRDGLVVDIPYSDESPPSKMISDCFPATAKRLGVYLGIPEEQPDGKTYELESKAEPQQTRYRTQDVRFVDATTGDAQQPVSVAKKRLQLLFCEERSTGIGIVNIPDGIEGVKIAELVRTQNGTITLDERYIPPLLWIAGSPTLESLVDGLINLLEERRTTFSDDQRGTIDLIGTDLRKFALASAIFTHLPVLRHLRQVEGGSPESLYVTMIRLAGQLMLLAPPGAAIELPQYQHKDLADTFHRLEKNIRLLVKGGMSGYTNIPLTREGSHWEGKLQDAHLFASAQFYVSVETPADLSDDEVRRLVPREIRISAPCSREELLRQASCGVTLTYKSSPPEVLPRKAGAQYFQLGTDDASMGKKFWEEIQREKKIALCVEGKELRSISPQLVAVGKME